MTTTQGETTEVSHYLAAIREALSDLREEERDELLEDLEAHLHEVVADSGTTLEASLGSATKYAAELRASAGLELGNALRRTGFGGMRSSWEVFAARPASQSVGKFLVTLRPAWWLVRGWLALFTVIVLTDGRRSAARQHSLWIPTYFGTALHAVVVTAAVAIASAWVGTRTSALTRPAKRAAFAFNALLIGFAVVFFPTFIDSSNASSFAPSYRPPPPGLVLDGHQLQNIYPYDAQGHLLTNVRLYDDRGNPLSLQGSQSGSSQGFVSYPTDSTGQIVTNDYPQTTTVLPIGGPAAPTSAAPLIVSPPSGAVTTSGEAVVPAPSIDVPPLAPAPTNTP